VMLNLPITQPLPKPPPKKVITPPKPTEPIKPIKPIEKPVVAKKTITTPVEPLPQPSKPVEKPVVFPKPPEKVVEVKSVEVVVPKEIPKEIPKEVVKELPKELSMSAVVELLPAPSPSPAPAPSPSPAPAPGAPKTGINIPNNVSNSNGSNKPASPGNSLDGFVVNPPNVGLGGGGTVNSPYQRKSKWTQGELAEMSRKQLNPDKRPENYEVEFGKAGKDDCLHPTNPGIRNLARMMNGDCPK
jgi:hypothetical protein